MRTFKNKWFARFARQEAISDAALCEAIAQAERGLIDANLGGSVIKQRIARPGQGKSGGFRSIILFRSGDRAFFVFGFAKSERDNISEAELKAYRKAAQVLLDYTDTQLQRAVDEETLIEVNCDEEQDSSKKL